MLLICILKVLRPHSKGAKPKTIDDFKTFYQQQQKTLVNRVQSCVSPITDPIKDLIDCLNNLGQVIDQCLIKRNFKRRRRLNNDGNQLIFDFYDAVERQYNIMEPFEYVYGKNSKLLYSNLDQLNETKINEFQKFFIVVTSSDSHHAEYISDDELFHLIDNDELNYNNFSHDDIITFVQRYNNSLQLIDLNIFNSSQITNDTKNKYNDNYYLMDDLIQLMEIANQSIITEQELGYNFLYESFYQTQENLINEAENPSVGICATVKIKLSQEAVLSRQAFQAILEINNQQNKPLTNVSINIEWFNEFGNAPDDAFYISDGSYTNGWINSNNDIGSNSIGIVSWTLIPRQNAVMDYDIVKYFIHGILQYYENNLLVTIHLFPQEINVAPDPIINLFYFWESVIYSDDPFTDEIEPSIPFSLVVAVKNSGKGKALNFKIQSSQPEIIENEKGLYISFEIIQAKLGNKKMSSTLNVNFGEIEPNSVEIGQWLFTSSLKGIFKNFNASFESNNIFGQEDLNLIQSIEIYDLNHNCYIRHSGIK